MWRKFFLGFIFALAFAYIESSVVVYLRGIYYPAQYHLFPIAKASPFHLFVEVGREFSTLVILFLVGLALGGFRLWTSILYFFYVFGLWDILYYFWLYVFIKWPPHPFEWDVLFLIPVPWLSPVICPVLVALLFASSPLLIVALEEKGDSQPTRSEWIPWVLGALLVFLSFVLRTILILVERGEGALLSYMPRSFDWWIYIPGVLLMTYGWIKFWMRIKSSR